MQTVSAACPDCLGHGNLQRAGHAAKRLRRGRCGTLRSARPMGEERKHKHLTVYRFGVGPGQWRRFAANARV